MQAFQGLRKFWIFKSGTNFSIFTFLSSGAAYLAIKYNKEKKLAHPVVDEALRIAEGNDQVIEMIGYPVTWQSHPKNQIDASDILYNGQFYIEGPKGQLLMHLAADCLPLDAIKADYERISKELTEKPTENTAENITKKNKLESFYILDPETNAFYEKHLNNKDAKLEEIPIPPKSKFWGIDYLFVDIDQNYRIVVIPRPMSEKSEDGKDIPVYTVDAKANLNKTTLKDIQEEQSKLTPRGVKSSGATEEEQEDIRKYRTREMYKKMNNSRFWMALGVGALGMISYILYSKYRRTSVRNSLLHLSAMNVIKSNDLAIKELGRQFNFLDQIRGAAIENKADFEIDAYGGKKKASFRVKGTLDEKTKKWNLERIDMIIRDKSTLEIISEVRIY